MTNHPIRKFLTFLGTAMAHPAAFIVVALFGVGWLLFDRASFNWHGAVTLVTLVMTLFIQRAEHRDTQAIHAKLDAILRADDTAEDKLTKLDDQEPEEIEAYRRKAKAAD